ncbi:MAG: DMT family transporter [Candidatus Thiodiazotropha lotti]|uniref:DMT family transporter n=1 Tax=Candidatus Thiodiazotropha lotti TaxID=2792787 RepID=A0A9E4K973_9GAMM|nr:DMT family transporter [Candidatus Thiodiazotropha lotti]MCW4205212.1 DMT family transporter [Candidatus Thiodiazotropha lotti]ODC01252.1 multidrug DMT transporter [Candidatus Thiodiazotropha endoloripes]
MSVPAAYVGVLLIWGTTPLAIQWSGQGVGYLFGVTGRMVIGVVLALSLLRLIGLRLAWHKTARHTYMAAGLGIFIAMTSVYWSAQYIPSGWISVIFGLSPIITGLMARYWLNERGIDASRLVAVLISLSGLVAIFSVGIKAGPEFALGLCGMLVSVITHSASAVWVKRIDAQLHGLVVTAGGLLVAVPLFLLSWFIQGESWPQVIGERALASIIYLGIIGSVLGFALYFYILKNVETTKVALITLITPLFALLAGQWLNGEQIDQRVWLGTGLILLGLALFEFWGRGLPQFRFSRARESEGQ